MANAYLQLASPYHGVSRASSLVDGPSRLSKTAGLALPSSGAEMLAAKAECGPMLQRLISEECGPETALALEQHASVLLNLGDLLIGSTVGESSLRALLRYMEELHVQLTHFRGQADRFKRAYEVAQWELQHEREGRNTDGFRSALGAMGQNQALEAERQARANLESYIRSLSSQVSYSSEMNQRQASELQAMSRYFAEVEVGMETRLRAEVARQQELMTAEHKRQLKQLRADHGLELQDAQQACAGVGDELDQHKKSVSALLEDKKRLEASLQPWSTLLSARLPVVLELVRFLCEESLQLGQQGLPIRGMVPVLALEWPPHTEIDTSLTWSALSPGGFFEMLSRLCDGELMPDAPELELTACCVDSRWIGALHGDSEAPRLAALLAFQALRPDRSILASCRIVPMRRPLLPKGVLELDPQRRQVAPVGVGRSDPYNCVAKGELSDEDRLRSFIKGCPIEREILSALCYVRAANPDALRRAPPPPLSGPPLQK